MFKKICGIGLVGVLTVAPMVNAFGAEIYPSEDAEALGQFISGDSLSSSSVDALSAYSSSPGRTNADSTPIDTEVLQAVGEQIPGISQPLIDDGSGEGLLDLSSAGALNNYAHSPDYDTAKAASGAVSGGGNIDVNNGEIKINLTRALEQLDLDGVTDQIVDELTLEMGAIASTAESNGSTYSSEYVVSDGILTLSSPAVVDLEDSLNDIVDNSGDAIEDYEAELEEMVSNVDISENVGLFTVNVSNEDVQYSIEVRDALNSVMENIINDELNDSRDIVSIDLQTGEIKVDLSKVVSGADGDDLNGLDPNTEIFTNDNIEKITDALADALGELEGKFSPAFNESLNNVHVIYEFKSSIEGAMFSGEGSTTVDLTLGQLAGTDTSDPVITTDMSAPGASSDQIVVAISENLTESIFSSSNSVASVLMDMITDDASMALYDIVEPVINSLDPVFEGLDQVVKVIVNEQPEDIPVQGDNGAGFTVNALSLELLPEADSIDINLASSSVRATDESPENPGDDDANTNASASAAASANADDNSNAAAEAAAFAAAMADATTTASASANVDAEAAAESAANEDASSEASADSTSSANSSASAAAQAASNADNSDDTNAAATAAADANPAAAASTASNATSSSDASAEAAANADGNTDPASEANASAAPAASANDNDDDNVDGDDNKDPASEASSNANDNTDPSSEAMATSNYNTDADSSSEASSNANDNVDGDPTVNVNGDDDTDSSSETTSNANDNVDGDDNNNTESSAEDNANTSVEGNVEADPSTNVNGDDNTDPASEASSNASSNVNGEDDANDNVDGEDPVKPTISTELPDGKIGEEYEGTITTDVGEIISVDGLPDGLEYEDGKVVGTPTKDGEFDVVIVADNDGSESSTTDSITISPEDVDNTPIISTELPNGKIGEEYEGTVDTDKGEITEVNNLPDGLEYEDNKVSGTPTKDGEFDVVIVADNDGETSTITETITIFPADEDVVQKPTISTELPNGKTGEEYEGTISTDVGEITDVDNLPTGLEYKDGKVSGTPEHHGISKVVITADNEGQISTETVLLIIDPADNYPADNDDSKSDDSKSDKSDNSKEDNSKKKISTGEVSGDNGNGFIYYLFGGMGLIGLLSVIGYRFFKIKK